MGWRTSAHHNLALGSKLTVWEELKGLNHFKLASDAELILNGVEDLNNHFFILSPIML